MDDLVRSKEKSVADLSQLAATLYSRVADSRIVNNTQQLSGRVGKLKKTTNVIRSFVLHKKIVSCIAFFNCVIRR
jgi:hypothetical protein